MAGVRARDGGDRRAPARLVRLVRPLPVVVPLAFACLALAGVAEPEFRPPYEWLWGLVGAALSLAVTAEVLRPRGPRRPGARRGPAGGWRGPAGGLRGAAGGWRGPDRLGLAVLAAGLVSGVVAARLPTDGHPASALAARVLGALGLTGSLAGLVLWLALLVTAGALSGRQWLVAAPAAMVTGGLVVLPLLAAPELPVGYPATPFAAVLAWGAGTVAGTTLAWAVDRPPEHPAPGST